MTSRPQAIYPDTAVPTAARTPALRTNHVIEQLNSTVVKMTENLDFLFLNLVFMWKELCVQQIDKNNFVLLAFDKRA